MWEGERETVGNMCCWNSEVGEREGGNGGRRRKEGGVRCKSVSVK